MSAPRASAGARSGARAGQDLSEVRCNPRNAKKGLNWPRLWVRRAALKAEDQHSSRRRVGVPHPPQNARAGGCYVPTAHWRRQRAGRQLWE